MVLFPWGSSKTTLAANKLTLSAEVLIDLRIVVYVDDILVASNDENFTIEFEEKLNFQRQSPEVNDFTEFDGPIPIIKDCKMCQRNK